MAGPVGPACDGRAQAVAAGSAEHDTVAFAGGVGDGRDAGLGGELGIRLETLTNVTELRKDRCGADSPGPREGHDDPAVGQVCDRVLYSAGKLANRPDERADARTMTRTNSPLASVFASPARPVTAVRRPA